MKEGLLSYIINLFKVLFTKGIVIIIGFLNSIIIARCLGVQGQGQYALAITIYSVGFQFINMGLHSAHTYYLAKDPNKISVVFGNSIAITCVSIALCMIINFLFALGKFEVGLPYEVMCISFYLIPCYLYYYLQYQTLLVMDKILVLSVLDIIIVLFPFIGNFLLYIAGVKSILAVLGFLLCSYLIVDIFGFIYVLGLCVKPRVSLKFYIKCIRLGVVASIACFLGYLVMRADIFMIQAMLGGEDTGIYSLAANLVEIVNTFAATCTMVMFPKVAAIQDKKLRYKFTCKIFKIICLCMMFIIILGESISGYLIPLVYGMDYASAVEIFRILLIGIIFWGLAGIPISYYTAEKKYGINLVSYTVAFFINIVLNYFWISKYGVAGAAFSSVVSYHFVLILTLIYFVLKK